MGPAGGGGVLADHFGGITRDQIIDHRFGDSLLRAGDPAAAAAGFGAEVVHVGGAGTGASSSSSSGNAPGYRDYQEGDEELPDGTERTLKINFDTLLYAVQNGDEFLVRTWLNSPAVGSRAPELINQNPALLNRAVFADNAEMVALLLEANADPDAGSFQAAKSHMLGRAFGGEQWPLRLAVQHGYYKVCKLLLEHNAKLELPKEMNRGAVLPMMAGLHTGNGDDNQNGLLGSAAFKGFTEIAELLLNANADVNGCDMEGKLPIFLTPLMHAAYNGRSDVVKLLLERSAQPNIGHDRQTHTALDFAEMQQHADCVTLLEPWRLPSSMSSSARWKGNPLLPGYAPLHTSHAPIPPPSSPHTSLSPALSRPPPFPFLFQMETLEKWINRGGDVNHTFRAQMPEGQAMVPLLVYAAMKGQNDVVEWLLARKADPDAVIEGDQKPTIADGHTAMMRACMAGHHLVVRKLLRAGAKMGQRSARGHTAMILAEQTKQNACSREFKEHLMMVAEEQRSTKLAQAREQADKDLAEAVSKLSLEEGLLAHVERAVGRVRSRVSGAPEGGWWLAGWVRRGGEQSIWRAWCRAEYRRPGGEAS